MPNANSLRIPKHGQCWRHNKSGTLYQIVCVTIRNETGNLAVIYAGAPWDPEWSETYDRDLSEFLGSDPDAKKDRFTFEREKGI